ncbi:MAG: GGDEF domain-containing protein [Methylococcales bacterium]|nr:GGDEF domain-containing protein [Methylococcales bacterium]
MSDIIERKAAEITLKHQAQYDFLTNLPNCVLLHDLFQQLLADAKRNNEVFALLWLDLNKFKLVNDTYGHHIGDLLLKEVAERFQRPFGEPIHYPVRAVTNLAFWCAKWFLPSIYKF